MVARCEAVAVVARGILRGAIHDMTSYLLRDTATVLPRELRVADLSPSLLRATYSRMIDSGYSHQSVRTYVAALKCAMRSCGVDVSNWPATPTLPRTKPREPISTLDLERLHAWFREAGFNATADLLIVLRATGMRVQREALHPAGWTLIGNRADCVVRIAGKGGHERIIPVEDAEAMHVMVGPAKDLFQAVSYDTHMRRWRAGVEFLQIVSRLPTPHSVRHKYATDALARCQNLELVREMMGHANITTTARYIGVDLGQMRKALCS